MLARLVAALVLLAAGCLAKPSLPGDGSGSGARCSSMTMLADNFQSGDFYPWWSTYGSDPAIQITATAGVARVVMAAEGYGNVQTDRFFDLRDASFSIDVSNEGVFPPTGEIGLTMFATSSPDTWLRMRRVGTTLRFEHSIAGMEFDHGPISYDPIAHRYWRIANTGGMTTWETSADGQHYDPMSSVSGLDWAAFMSIELQAKRAPGDTAFNAVFDDVNGGVASGVACPASSLVDAFAGDTVGEQWARRKIYEGTLAETGGELVADTWGTGMFSQAIMTAATIYDLSNDRVAVEVAQIVAPAGASDVDLQVETVDGGAARFVMNNNQLSAFNDGAAFHTQPFDPIAHRWWRLRGDHETLFWEVSSNGSTYDSFASAPVIGLHRSDVSFGVDGMAANTVHFDNVNAP